MSPTVVIAIVAVLWLVWLVGLWIFCYPPRWLCRFGVHSRKSAGRNPDGSVTHSGPCIRCGAQMDAEVYYPRGEW